MKSCGASATAPHFESEPGSESAHADWKSHFDEVPERAERSFGLSWSRTEKIDDGVSRRGDGHKHPRPKPEEIPVTQLFGHGYQGVGRGLRAYRCVRKFSNECLLSATYCPCPKRTRGWAYMSRPLSGWACGRFSPMPSDAHTRRHNLQKLFHGSVCAVTKTGSIRRESLACGRGFSNGALLPPARLKRGCEQAVRLRARHAAWAPPAKRDPIGQVPIRCHSGR